MIDYFTLALTHGLIVIALWRLLSRPDLDVDPLADSMPEPQESPADTGRAGARGRTGRRGCAGRGGAQGKARDGHGRDADA